MIDAIVQWFQAATWGVPHWAGVAVLAMAVVERFLGRSKNPRIRSIMALVAHGMSWVLMTTRIGRIPVLGTTVVKVLELIAGQDIDGDGKVGDAAG